MPESGLLKMGISFLLLFFGCLQIRAQCAKSVSQALEDSSRCAVIRSVSGSIPSGLAHLTGLKFLRLKGRHLRLPSDTAFWNALSQLKELNLKHTGIKSLPASMAGLKNIRVLDISKNPVDSWPAVISGFKNIEVINAWDTGLESLPDFFAKLPHLRRVNMRNNHITPKEQEYWKKKYPNIELLFSEKCHCQ